MIKVFDCFAGYGGAEFALKKAGIEHECMGFSEIDKYAIKCFQQNHCGANYGNITKINWRGIPYFDLLTGGFPCQDISQAGEPKEIMVGHCVRAEHHNTADVHYVPKNGLVRRLTPKECFRLMGFLKDEINLEGLSDTQKYKLAGNGWDINLVSQIFKSMQLNEAIQ